MLAQQVLLLAKYCSMAISAIVLLLPVISLGWSEQVEFDCPPLPPLKQPARSVHELRPQDIKVVMALGDSVTAGEASYYRHPTP